MIPELEAYDTWYEGNQEFLYLALNRLCGILQSYIAQLQDDAVASANIPTVDFNKIAQKMSAPPALLQLCQFFNLSEFERDILLLCAQYGSVKPKNG